MAPFVRTLSPLSDEQAAKIHPAGGGVVAIPHFAEFVPAIISVALSAPPGRRVAIFYESPDTVANNAVFNRIADRAIPQLDRDVVICHNNASGLASALKVVRSGGTLIIMPDVVKDASLGTAMPFLSRTFVAMTGIGSIVRKTAVPLIPIIPRTPLDASLSIGTAITVDTLGDPTDGNAEQFPDYIDYCVMRKMFESMDAIIGCRQAFWTYWLCHSEPFQLHAHPSSEARQARDLLKDPLLSVHTRPVIDVSASAHE
jgi:lauroyl/myristoyl acyltransferase